MQNNLTKLFTAGWNSDKCRRSPIGFINLFIFIYSLIYVTCIMNVLSHVGVVQIFLCWLKNFTLLNCTQELYLISWQRTHGIVLYSINGKRIQLFHFIQNKQIRLRVAASSTSQFTYLLNYGLLTLSSSLNLKLTGNCWEAYRLSLHPIISHTLLVLSSADKTFDMTNRVRGWC